LQKPLRRSPGEQFLATVLSRENAQELAVLSRKFRNLHGFGCWWFNQCALFGRRDDADAVELVGLRSSRQHSDARVRTTGYKCATSGNLARVLADKYADLARTGWGRTTADNRA